MINGLNIGSGLVELMHFWILCCDVGVNEDKWSDSPGHVEDMPLYTPVLLHTHRKAIHLPPWSTGIISKLRILISLLSSLLTFSIKQCCWMRFFFFNFSSSSSSLLWNDTLLYPIFIIINHNMWDHITIGILLWIVLVCCAGKKTRIEIFIVVLSTYQAFMYNCTVKKVFLIWQLSSQGYGVREDYWLELLTEVTERDHMYIYVEVFLSRINRGFCVCVEKKMYNRWKSFPFPWRI